MTFLFCYATKLKGKLERKQINDEEKTREWDIKKDSHLLFDKEQTFLNRFQTFDEPIAVLADKYRCAVEKMKVLTDNRKVVCIGVNFSSATMTVAEWKHNTEYTD